MSTYGFFESTVHDFLAQCVQPSALVQYVGGAVHLSVISVNASQSDYLPLMALPKALQWDRLAVGCRQALNIHLSLELLLTSSRK